MLKATALISALALTALPAMAQTEVQRADPTTHRVTTALPDDVVEVQSSRPNPAATVIGDALGGAVLGAAVGGGVAAYNRYGTNGGNGSWGNWQRDVLVGAGIGLGVGLIVGGISAASQSSAPDRTYSATADGYHDVGFAPAQASYGTRF